MSTDGWLEIINWWAPHTKYFSILGGEPMLHHGIFNICEHLSQATKRYGTSYGITTNATLYEDTIKLVRSGLLTSIAVSCDSLDGNYYDESAEIKSKAAHRLLTDIESEDLDKIVCIVVTRHNINEVVGMVKYFTDIGVISAVCVLQTKTDNLRQNPSDVKFDVPQIDLHFVGNKLADMAESGNYLLGEPPEYYRLWPKLHLGWHCGKSLGPSIDYDGSLWVCFDYKGTETPKLNAFDSPFSEIEKSLVSDSERCGGCTWNNMYTLDCVRSGRIPRAFWR